MGLKQILQVQSVLFNNADVEDVPEAILQEIVDNPQRSGAEFTIFLRNGARMMVEQPTILDCSETFDPVTFPGLGKDWPVWKGLATGKGLEGEEDRDSRADALTQLDPTTIQFETCLKDEETRIRGEEKLSRLKKKTDRIRLSGNQFLALWSDYKARGKDSVLEWLRKNRGITYLDFFGLVLRDPDGYRSVLYLCFYYG